jgi:hypothetical protein
MLGGLLRAVKAVPLSAAVLVILDAVLLIDFGKAARPALFGSLSSGATG